MGQGLKGHRRDIEGLRGISILSVVLYHLDSSLLPGGLTGVDVFFVISGFLITGILLREVAASGRVDLAGFWARRARRILPSASLVLLATALACPFFVSPLLLEHVGKDILAAGYFGLNWRAARRAVDYFAPGEDASPMLHFWSLAVEEQFYLTWPLVLVALVFLARRTPPRTAVTVTLAVASLLLSSFALCVLFTPANQPLAFFGTFSRVWQLLAGAVAAILVFHAGSGEWPFAKALGPLGLLAILVGFFRIEPDGSFPGWISALPVVGATGVILAGSTAGGANWAARLLSVAPLTLVGRVSYVWYLWHWPFLYFGRAANPGGGLAFSASLLGVSFLVATATHHLFENPIRFHPRLLRSPRRSLGMGGILVGLAVLAGLGVERYAEGITVTLGSGRKLLVEDIRGDRSGAYRLDCHASQSEARPEKPCVFGDASARPELVLLGDSHAAHFFDAVRTAASNRRTAFLMRSKSGCPALDATIWNVKFKRRYLECETWLESVLATIRELRPKLVILSNSTHYFFLEEGATEPVDTSERPALYKQALRRMIERLLDGAERVAWIEGTPLLPEEPVLCLYRNPGDEGACGWPVDGLSRDGFAPDLDGLEPRVSVVDLNPEICPGGICRAASNGTAVFFDRSHLTASFSLRLVKAFEAVLIEAGL